ncbi:hypothetical protein BDZ91DRAFT_797049 [Kalaharituber pfeilii]|nr:hypothetical protein BDZ91DRAFT_797049 [Kalaharituber pfeilii]
MDQERSTGSGRFNFFSRLPAQKPYHHSPAHRPGYDGPMLEPVFPGAFPTAPTPPTTHFAHKPPPQPYARYAHTAPPPPQVEGPPGQGHIPTHKMNVIVDWTPETTEKLVNDDYYPSNLYLDMIDAIFNFIHKHPSTRSAPGTPVRDRSAGGSGAGVAGAGVLSESGPVPREHRVEFEVLEASKLARFYRAMGMNDQDNSYLIGSAQLSSLYSRLGLEYILIPSPSLRASLSDRTFPWQIDNLDTTPSEPALTRSGFRRSFVLGTFLNPAGTHYILQNLLSTGKLVNPITEVPFKASVPRETLPKEPLEDLLAWERGMGI